MGLLDRYRKEERKRVIRDEEGTRLETTYTSSRTPVSDKFLAMDKERRREDRSRWKQRQRDEYRKSFREARLKRIKQAGYRAGSTTWGDRLGSWADNISRQSSGRSMSYSSPMENMFTMGGGPPRRKSSGKKKPGKKGKYIVRGGVAYPIAGGKKKKKTSKKRSYDNPFDFKI